MYDMNEAVKQTKEDIAAMEAVNKILPEFKKVVAKWDGKVFNKRFEADMKAAIPGHIYLVTHYETTYEIHYQPENTHKWYTILSGSRPTCKYWTPENSFLTENKRLDKERAFQLIENRRVERLKEITQYKEHLETWQAKKEQLQQLEKAIKAITDTIPYQMQDYFNMHYRVSTH